MRLTSDYQLRVKQRQLDTIANNIANTNTPGFKSNFVNFLETDGKQKKAATIAQYGGVPGALGPQGVALYTGHRFDFSQGGMAQADNQWDLAIDGPGFFQVQAADGITAYTRVGNFSPDQNGQLVNAEGKPLQPPVIIPAGASDVSVKANGEIAGTVGGEPVVFGNIVLVNFDNPDGLQQIGDNLFAETASSGQPLIGVPGSGDFGLIQAGMQEQSNVDLAQSMTDLIQAQRAYQMDIRLVQDEDEMNAKANALRR